MPIVVTILLRDAKVLLPPTFVASHREPLKQKHSGPILTKPAHKWYVQEWYVELRIFKMEVLNIPDTKPHELLEESRSHKMKLVGLGGPID